MTIIVPENPTTGYIWEVDESRAGGLWSVTSEFSANQVTIDAFGNIPGAKKFTLSGFKSGEGVFRAILVDPYVFDGFFQADKHQVDGVPIDELTIEGYREKIQFTIKIV